MSSHLVEATGLDSGLFEHAKPHFDEDIVLDARRTNIRNTRNAWIIRVVALAAFLLGWAALSGLGLVRILFISDPAEVIARLGHLIVLSNTWYNVWQTFETSLISLAIGAVLGIGCGVLFTTLPTVSRALNPYVTMFNALPRPALAPLFILWFGLGATAKVFVGVSIVFFILLLNTIAGLQTVDPDLRVLTDSLGASRWQRFLHVELPSSLPSIVAGLRLGAVYAVLGVVVSEMVAAYSGLGTMLVHFSNGFDISGTFAVLILITAVATVLDIAVRQVERRIRGRYLRAKTN